MVGDQERRQPERGVKPTYVVVLEHKPSEDAEERLLQVYELLIGLADRPETCPEEEELT
jgi:hypothetical protein